jgi:hypothetical protein
MSLIATVVMLIGSSVAVDVWFARKRDKKFLEQMKSLQPREKKPVKDAEVVSEK